MTNWHMVFPACALAATLAVGACGRDDDSTGNQWAGKPDKGQEATNASRDNTNGLAGNGSIQDADRTNDASGMAINLVGCLRRAGPGSGRYVLSDVQTAGMGTAPESVGTSGRTGDRPDESAAAGDRYDLVARSGQELGDHVGHRVKVTGRLATPAGNANGSAAHSPGSAAGTTGTGSPSADSGIDRGAASDAASRTMYVSSVQRFGEDTCSSSSPGR